eukprot:TRINITY_DN25821_c0_g1_i2.p1 TRINITY_DN25821_c0_g1~~TRINITY_DN25821_c0_g1_i2.p1  ORF type:complete len:135 (+),score=41.53 TRINITY_DN25821_c0_g1_i2:51-455(+)
MRSLSWLQRCAAAAASPGTVVPRRRRAGSSPGPVLPPHLEAARAAVAEGTGVIVDVREEMEWHQGHLRDARLVPLSALQAGARPSLPPGCTLYLHCRAGVRVHAAAPILQELGYSTVPLQEGFQELVALGFEAE